MITHILLDADGVTIKAHEYFSTFYARENNLPIDVIEPFFKEKFPACTTGQADFKIEFPPFLQKWNPNETLENYMAKCFAYNVHEDEQVMNLVKKLKPKGIKFYLATDQEKYRAEYIKNYPQLAGIFEQTFFSCDLGVTKDKPEFFQKILSALQIQSNQTAFFDDDQINVDSAKEAGIHSFFYSDLETFKQQLQSLDIDAQA